MSLDPCQVRVIRELTTPSTLRSDFFISHQPFVVLSVTLRAVKEEPLHENCFSQIKPRQLLPIFAGLLCATTKKKGAHNGNFDTVWH